jgi:hypothetical protein
MSKLISSNNYSVLALLLMMQNNEQIGNYIVEANANNPDAGWDLGEISETMAETLNVATNDEDTRLTAMMLNYFNQKTGWEIISYKTNNDFDKCRGESQQVDFYHDAAETDYLLKLIDDNEVVKIRTSDGEESAIYRSDDWEIILLRKLKEEGVHTELSLSGEIILVGVHNTTVSDVVETVAANNDGSTMDSESEDFVEMIKEYNAKLHTHEGFITFTHV